jgi:hypothetical protein
MANNNFGEVFVNGQLVVFKDEKMARWYFTEVIGSGNKVEPEVAPPSPKPQAQSYDVPDGWELCQPFVRSDYRYRWADGRSKTLVKHDIVAKELGYLPHKGTKPSTKPQAADSNYTTFSGQLVIAGQQLPVRLAEGKLHRSGKEATNIHFQTSLKGTKFDAVRQALKDAHFRFSGYLTNQVDDSQSTWYIPGIFSIAQIQDMMD